MLTLLANLFGVLPLLFKFVGMVMERKDGQPVSVRKVRRRARDLVDLADIAVLSELQRRPEETTARRALIAQMASEGFPEALAAHAVYEAARDLARRARRKRR